VIRCERDWQKAETNPTRAVRSRDRLGALCGAKLFRVTGREDAVSRTRLTRAEMLEAAKTIRRLLDLLRAGELTAPAMLVARLEGALVALEVVATGRAPAPDDFLKGDSLHNTNV
jgi:hypothetical protein